MKTKICSKCRETLPIKDFYEDKNYPDGYFCWCKSCKHAYYKSHYEAHKEDYYKRNKEWYENHKR